MTPESLVHQTEDLFSFPDAAMRLQELIDSPSARAQDLADVIQCDPALTARLLRLVNSPAYAPVTPVTSIAQAISLIGARALRDLILATCAIDAFNGLPNDKINMERFWLHAVACGIASRTLAQQRGMRASERLFITGLLHRIGKLVLLSQCGEQYLAVLELIEHDAEADVAAAEEQVFGFNYAQVGAALLQAWHFPETIWIPVLHQLHPDQAPDHRSETETLHAAEMVATEMLKGEVEQGDASAVALAQIQNAAVIAEPLGLSAELIRGLPQEINLEIIAMLETLVPGCSLLI